MEKSNQLKINRNNQRTLTVKFVATRYENDWKVDIGIWILHFNKSIDEIKKRFEDGCISVVETLVRRRI